MRTRKEIEKAWRGLPEIRVTKFEAVMLAQATVVRELLLDIRDLLNKPTEPKQ